MTKNLNSKLSNILCRILPWWWRIRELNERCQKALAVIHALKAERDALTHQVDSLQRQLNEVVQVNGFNAAAHRASEVASLRQNHRLQALELMIQGRDVPGELRAAVADLQHLAMKIPKSISVEPPKRKGITK